MKETVITDDKSTIIDRKEIEKKIQKISSYKKKAELRLDQLNKELENIRNKGDDEKLEQGLNYYNLLSKVSKQI